jgi:glyceraldehyde 3-phosphate dehydrogenase
MATKIAINGFGRIGRCVARVLFDSAESELELVAINDLTDAKTLAHLLQFDSVHRTFKQSVKAEGNGLVIGNKQIPIYAERDPAKLPWKDLGVEIVLECTGIFRSKAKANAHLTAGAKRVIISAPGENDIDATFCVGINSNLYDPAKHTVFSNASCTTNCLAPIAKVLQDTFGIVKGHMVTVHSYTNDQQLLDLPHKDLRRARAAALSMIPSTTPDVSLTCLTAQVGKSTTRDEVNAALKAAADGPLKGILGFEPRQLVSSDFIGDSRSSIVDADQTQVVGGDLVEVQAWYDNEWGFSTRMVDLTRLVAKKG